MGASVGSQTWLTEVQKGWERVQGDKEHVKGVENECGDSQTVGDGHYLSKAVYWGLRVHLKGQKQVWGFVNGWGQALLVKGHLLGVEDECI